MKPNDRPVIECESPGEFARVMAVGPPPSRQDQGGAVMGAPNPPDAEKVKDGLAQLVLTLVKLLHELLERQAIRRIEAGSLSDAQIEDLGQTLMKQAEVIERLRDEFGLEPDDLNLDLGPLGKLL
jgi:hypothetical protein